MAKASLLEGRGGGLVGGTVFLATWCLGAAVVGSSFVLGFPCFSVSSNVSTACQQPLGFVQSVILKQMNFKYKQTSDRIYATQTLLGTKFFKNVFMMSANMRQRLWKNNCFKIEPTGKFW